MKKTFLKLLLTLLFIGFIIPDTHAFANYLDDNYINIKLTSPIESKNTVKLYSDDGFYLYNKDDLRNPLEYIDSLEVYISIDHKGEIVIEDQFKDIVFTYYEEENIIVTSKNENKRKLKIGDKAYRDFVYFIIENDEISVINYVELNNYLYGVVPREMPASFPMDALKAQAIASRTYTLHNINKHKSQGYNLCDTDHCQVYGGVDGEHERTNTAVDETKGMVITYNGSIIDASYHSNSGGYTEDAKDVWGNSVPYLKAVNDEFSKGSPNSNWSVMLTKDELVAKLRNSGINIGDIVDLEIIETSSTGRVSKLKIKGDFGEEVLSGSRARQIFGTSDLKTTWFTIKKENGIETNNTIYAIEGEETKTQIVDLSNSYIIDEEFNKGTFEGKVSSIISGSDKVVQVNNTSTFNIGNFLIEGRGWGHGVGMSQWGAKGMAESGYSFEEILKHYYTGVDITTRY